MNDRDSDDLPCWDALVALADLTFDFAEHDTKHTVPDNAQLHRWWESVSNIHAVTEALIIACEDLIELNLDEPRFVALKISLARAQGLPEYWRRKDRW
jgi:hypothetical protein